MKKLLFSVLILSSAPSLAQTSVGLETQVYPAGIVPGLRFDIGIYEDLNLTSRIGYNFTNRRDWGENDNEEGGGPGFSLGLERTGFLTENLSVHLRSDFWFMEIDWRETEIICPIIPPCGEVEVTGTSSITIFQPTLGLGYELPILNHYFIKPSLSFGYEINIKTEGREVGQGAILLVGFQLGRFLK